MGLKGKIVGGGIGFVFGGPWGAVAGATVGHLYDNDDYGKKSPSVRQAIDDKHYKTLGCSFADSNETIRAQYRKLVKEYHPDAIAARNLPEESVVAAGQRFHEIQVAWDALRKERNI